MLEKNYTPKDFEEKIYADWENSGDFQPDMRSSSEAFSIVIPPPNVTGVLHLGHALDDTLQDILVRYNRMQGKKVLWQPGTDHAGIATQMVVERNLAKEGVSRHDLGREKFIETVWKWKEQSGGTICKQLRRLGASCDWSRERFTMDEGLSRAVRKIFVNMYKDGLIYKAKKLVNWDSKFMTAVSDLEVVQKETVGKMYYYKYPIENEPGEFIHIATTRPETMFGDTAVAVSKDNEKLKHLIGKNAILPIVNRPIPIVADDHADPEKGTGAVKITPAHDFNDFEVGKRHNLPMINILNEDATLNENTPFPGMDTQTARRKTIEKLEELGLMEKIEDHPMVIPYGDRSGVVIEPLMTDQWFVDAPKLAVKAIEAVENGDMEFVPKSYEKTYFEWMRNIQPWCISRQLWWGHRIPAYYCDDCGEMTVAKCAPAVCPKCGGTHLHQDEDTLDTWFSSALWPFSTLGWPKDTPEYEYFYPTDVLVTGYDIIFFWVIRMVFSGLEQTGKEPFHTVLIHGLVRDSQGRKMSKSLGNGIDPLEVIDKYGADALRMTLMTGNAPGNDMRFYWERVEASRNFANKVWNASRFIMMNIEKAPVTDVKLSDLQMADRWILSKVNTLAKDVTENMDKYELGIALQKVYDFIWEEFCDWYIEMVKPRLWSEEDTTKAAALWTLKTVLIQSLKLLHPYMPFITEEIFCNLQDEEPSIMISSWPEYKDEWNFADEEKAVETIKDAVRAIRGVRTSMNVPPSKKAKVYVVSEDPEVLAIFEHSRVFFATLGYASEVVLQKDKSGIADDAVSAVTAKATIYMPFAELVDLDKEIERLTKEEEKLKKELARSEGMLSNEKFVSRAPEAKIAEEREKLEKYRQMMAQVQERLAQLRK